MDNNNLTLEDSAAEIENWKILCLDRTYPTQYQQKVERFKKLEAEQKANK